MTLRSIMVATDLSVQEDLAVRRALRFAIAHDATITLKYVPATGQEPAPDAAARLARLAHDLRQGLGLRIASAAVKPHKVEDLCARARGVDLLVLPHRHERSTAAFFRGQPVLRLLRTARCPVLVTRQPLDAAYERMLVYGGTLRPEEGSVLRLRAIYFDALRWAQQLETRLAG